MILVDSSVLINYLKGVDNANTMLFDDMLKRKIPYGIASYTYQEVLQGAKNEPEYSRLKEYLSVQTMFFPPEEKETYEEAAQMCCNLRRHGIKPKSVVDVLIAFIAIRYDLTLLHDDKEFDMMASVLKELKILKIF